ncbi:MAG: exodeoxyribonuclease VII small subunit [Erysipelotrichaceae bacterium]|nr:exodeoxyribonuclease VII small subunit [Erysipelotrichaceae bacterium]
MENQNKLTFQQAMSRLESITEQLNNSSLELETAMSLFKEGLALSQQCEGQLKAFETEMNQLIVDSSEN